MLLVIAVIRGSIGSSHSGAKVGVNLGCGLYESGMKFVETLPLGLGNCIRMNWESLEAYPRKGFHERNPGCLSLFFNDMTCMKRDS